MLLPNVGWSILWSYMPPMDILPRVCHLFYIQRPGLYEQKDRHSHGITHQPIGSQPIIWRTWRPRPYRHVYRIHHLSGEGLLMTLWPSWSHPTQMSSLQHLNSIDQHIQFTKEESRFCMSSSAFPWQFPHNTKRGWHIKDHSIQEAYAILINTWNGTATILLHPRFWGGRHSPPVGHKTIWF